MVPNGLEIEIAAFRPQPLRLVSSPPADDHKNCHEGYVNPSRNASYRGRLVAQKTRREVHTAVLQGGHRARIRGPHRLGPMEVRHRSLDGKPQVIIEGVFNIPRKDEFVRKGNA